jgi:Firmicute plasmid replication protein (RepL)
VVGALFCNPRTGEYIEPTHVLIPRRETVRDWLMIFHRSTEVLAKDKEIGAEGLRVFLYVISQVDYENKLLVTQTDVKEALGMKQQHVSRAFRLLVEKEILIESGKVGTSKVYYLNPYVGWKGTARNLKKGLQDGFKWEIKRSPQKEVDLSSSPKLEESVA